MQIWYFPLTLISIYLYMTTKSQKVVAQLGFCWVTCERPSAVSLHPRLVYCWRLFWAQQETWSSRRASSEVQVHTESRRSCVYLRWELRDSGVNQTSHHATYRTNKFPVSALNLGCEVNDEVQNVERVMCHNHDCMSQNIHYIERIIWHTASIFTNLVS